MIKILPFADLHYHHRDSDNEPIYSRIKSLKAYPDHWKVISGDITDDGRPDQYQKAVESLSELERVIVLPGNHDYGAVGSIYNEHDARMFDDFASAFNEKPFFDKVPVVIGIENVLIILLNSCLKTEDIFDFACGDVSREQLQRLTTILDDPTNKDLVKIVALHHHPFIHSDPTMKLLDADRLARVVYGKVDIMLFGHKHEAAKWKNKVGCRYILAAGAFYQENTIDEITIEGKEIYLRSIQIY